MENYNNSLGVAALGFGAYVLSLAGCGNFNQPPTVELRDKASGQVVNPTTSSQLTDRGAFDKLYLLNIHQDDLEAGLERYTLEMGDPEGSSRFTGHLFAAPGTKNNPNPLEVKINSGTTKQGSFTWDVTFSHTGEEIPLGTYLLVRGKASDGHHATTVGVYGTIGRGASQPGPADIPEPMDDGIGNDNGNMDDGIGNDNGNMDDGNMGDDGMNGNGSTDNGENDLVGKITASFLDGDGNTLPMHSSVNSSFTLPGTYSSVVNFTAVVDVSSHLDGPTEVTLNERGNNPFVTVGFTSDIYEVSTGNSLTTWGADGEMTSSDVPDSGLDSTEFWDACWTFLGSDEPVKARVISKIGVQ